MVAEFLELTPPTNPQRNAPTWTMALAEYITTTDEAGHGQWVMHDELYEAMRSLNMSAAFEACRLS